MPEPLRPQPPRKLLILGEHWIVASDGEDELQTRELRQPAGIVLAKNEIGGIVMVDGGVGISIGLAPNVVHPAESNGAVDELWIAKREGHGVVGAEARAHRHQKRMLIALDPQRQYL